jgi:DNA-binding winged helix-turn-helix (wHTH) protein
VKRIVVDTGARLVRNGNIDVHLPPKAFDLLVLLIKSHPSAVSHERLHAALWPGVHVSETSLPALVTQLRKALGDERIIRTLHRVGYAFEGDAEIVGSSPAAAPSPARLVCRGAIFDVPAGTSVIGRERVCEIRIDAESISRQHARITVTGGEVWLEDLGSKNGTWVAGERIRARVALTDGGSFRLGSETIRLDIGGEPRATKTVREEDAE